MKKIGFVGLGNMGMGMALNLVRAGYEVTGLDLVKEKEEFFEKHGGKIANNNKEVGKVSELVHAKCSNGSIFYGLCRNGAC